MVRKETILFLTGFLSSALIFYFIFYVGVEVPLITGMSALSEISPSDWVSREDIILTEDYVMIRVHDATISNYAATGSMKPLLDERSNGIRIVPKDSKEIGVEDIISFERDGRLLVHRVTEIGSDEFGEYFITQGDNTSSSDGKVRFEEIKYVTIGILW